MLQLVELLLGKAEAVPMDVLVARHPADGSFAAQGAAVCAIHHPLQHAHILAIAGPQELAVGILQEPIHMKNPGCLTQAARHLDPMPEIVAHVIAAEGQHRHGVAAHLADGAGCGRGHFRSHRRAGINARAPIEGLIHQRHRRRAAAAEDERADRHALGSFPRRIDSGALRRGRGETGIGVRRFRAGLLGDLRRPAIALPVEAFGWRFVGHALPPHAAFGSQRDIGEDRVARQRIHGVRIRVARGARSHAEEAGFRVDGAQAAVGVGLDPRDVVADRPDLPALESGRRNQHGEIGFSAGAGKRRGDVGLLALRVLDAHDEHVLRHPAFVTRDVRSDAQREALLAQQRVAAVAGTVGPDLARLREMNDVLFLIAGPRNIVSAVIERSAHAMHARNHALVALIDFLEHALADAGHDAHADDDIRRIRQLHADLRHRAADGAHAERQHIHGAARACSR